MRTGATSSPWGAFRGGPVGDATVEDLERWLAAMRAQGLAPSTLARRVSAVRTYFRHLMLIGTRYGESRCRDQATPSEHSASRGRCRRERRNG